ncbi:MAG: MFS transporter [Rhodospirillales bacterium]|nr:MFS transporter [Rhodospirillales bacterium]
MQGPQVEEHRIDPPPYTETRPAASVAGVIVATTLVQAFVSWAAVVLPSIAPAFAQAFTLSPALIGFQVSLVYGGAILTSAFAGGMVRRYGACRTSQIALVLSAAGCALIALPTLIVLPLASLSIGFGYGLTNPAAAHLIARLGAARHRNILFSAKQTGVPLGGVIAGMLAPPAAVAFGWQAAPLMAAAACVVLGLALQSVRARWDLDRDRSAPIADRPFAGVTLVWGDTILRRIALMSFCYSLAQVCLTTFLVTLLVEEAGFALVAAGFALALVQAASVGGRLFWGWAADRIGHGLALLTALGLMTAVCSLAVAGLTQVLGAGLLVALFVVFGFAAVGWNGVYLAEVARLAGAKAGEATGGSLVITFAGVLVGPALFSLIVAGIGGYAAAFAAVAAVALIGVGFAPVRERAGLQ